MPSNNTYHIGEIDNLNMTFSYKHRIFKFNISVFEVMNNKNQKIISIAPVHIDPEIIHDQELIYKAMYGMGREHEFEYMTKSFEAYTPIPFEKFSLIYDGDKYIFVGKLLELLYKNNINIYKYSLVRYLNILRGKYNTYRTILYSRIDSSEDMDRRIDAAFTPGCLVVYSFRCRYQYFIKYELDYLKDIIGKSLIYAIEVFRHSRGSIRITEI